MSDGMTSYNVIEGYDELCSEILALHDEEAKIPLYQELQQKLVDDPPFLYLFQQNSIYAISSRLDWDVNSNCYILAFDMAVKGLTARRAGEDAFPARLTGKRCKGGTTWTIYSKSAA